MRLLYEDQGIFLGMSAKDMCQFLDVYRWKSEEEYSDVFNVITKNFSAKSISTRQALVIGLLKQHLCGKILSDVLELIEGLDSKYN